MPTPFKGAPEPFGWPGYAQRLPITVDPRTGQGAWVQGDLRQLRTIQPPPPLPRPVDQFTNNGATPGSSALGAVFVHNHPSPLDTKPLQGTREQYNATIVIDAPGASAAVTAGSNALAEGYEQFTGTAVTVESPAAVGTFVTVLSFQVPRGRAFLIDSVAAEGHDYAALKTAIRWRVRVGSTLVVPETELCQIGAPANQLKVQELATEQQTVYFEARNLDTASGTLLTAYLLGWSFPLTGTGTSWPDLVGKGA